MSSEFSPEVLGLIGRSNAETIKIEPVVPGLITKPTEQDHNFWTTLGDMALSIPQGVTNAVENAGDFIDENIVPGGGLQFGDGDGKLSFKDFIPTIVSPSKWKSEEYSKKRQLPVFHKPETFAGHMTEGISRFITGFAGPAKFLKGVGLTGTYLKATGRALIAGGVSDLFVFDGNEGRLSDMLVEFDSPVLNNAVTQFLATDENDTEMEGRLKNVLEGMVAGGIVEGTIRSIFYGIKGFKKMKATTNLKERAKVQKEVAGVIEDAQKGLKTLRVRQFALEGDEGINIKLALEGDTPINIKLADKIIDSAVLPKELKGAKPKYNYGSRSINLEFDNDIAKALYIVGGKGKSISHESYMLFLEQAGVKDIAKKSQAIRDSIKSQAKSGLDTVKISAEIPKKLDIIPKKIDEVKLETPSIKPKEALRIIAKSKETAKKDSELWIQKILNTKSFTVGGSVLRTVDNILENGLDDVTKEFLQNDVLTNKTALELAGLVGGNQKEILESIITAGVRDKDAVIRMLISKSVFQKLAEDYQKVSIKYLDEFGEDVANWSKEAKLDTAQRRQVIQEVFVALKKQIRGGARTTQAGRIKVPAAEGKIFDMDKVANIFKDFDANPAVIAKKIRDMKPEDVINQLTKSKWSKAIEVFNSLYINSILSGTPTFMVNALGNAYELIIKPLEMASGAILRGDMKTMRYGLSHYYGMSFTMRDTIKAVGLSLRQGDAILDPLVRTQDNLQIINGKAVRPISGSNLGFGGVAGKATDAIGIISEFPVRLLAGTDELFKQMNYRGRLYAEAIENTLELGFKLGSKEANENIDKIFKNGFKENGMANVKDNPMAARALDHARIASFTNLLDDGRLINIGLGVEKFLKQVPALRFLAPFVRTPTQLWRNFEQRIPIFGALTKPMRDLWTTGGPKGKADVLGRQLFGIATTITAYNYAMQDVTDSKGNKYRKVTGQGPKDYALKRLWQNSGWQEYSIAQKNKDGTITYKQYNRNDPRFYVLGIMADIFENKDNINDEKKQDMAWVAIVSAMRSAGNKGYLRGVSDAFDMVDNLEDLPQYVGKQLANAIPYTALRNQGIPGITEPDKDMFQTRSFIDEIIKKSPFLTKTDYLEPRRDILTGNPIERTPSSVYWNPEGLLSYITQGPVLVGRKVDVKEDQIGLEIMRLKIKSIKEPSIKQHKIVNLIDYKIGNQSAHNYWVERIGKTTRRGLTLKEQLEITFDSIEYQGRQEGNENFVGGKEMTIKRIFQTYTKKAEQDMLEKYPEVEEAYKMAQIEKYSFRKRSYDIDEQPKELLPRR